MDCGKEIERTGLNHKRCSLCAIGASREAKRRYRKTPRGKKFAKAGIKRYRKTPKGKAKRRASSKRWRNTPKGVVYTEQYWKTEEGKASRIRSQLSPLTKHFRLKEMLIKESVPKTDPLWKLDFYWELVKDRLCHYCLGSLSPLGHNLDRTNNDLGHVCYNVVPCCRTCNRIKGHDVSYDEMMIIAPALREIRRLRVSLN
jgi:hypothetical protein